jgi:phosphatidylserine/phosphatidylglycerophosphate/cardiolipin synthase-like enzyme
MIAVAEAVIQHGGKDRSVCRQAILESLPTADFRDATTNFIDQWYSTASSVGPDAVAVALVTAAKIELGHRQAENVEVVWSGPEPARTTFRQTEQAILEVINSAVRRLTIVSYAVYRIPRICEALVSAANRGVRINVIIETPDRIEGQTEYSTIQALGNQVGAVSSVYYWPPDKRIAEDGGKPGILHVKCAVADGRVLFLSSANLTEYAFTVNMELGLLVTGGRLPCEVEEQFDRLIEIGVLERV